jgi:hypothetical protein
MSEVKIPKDWESGQGVEDSKDDQRNAVRLSLVQKKARLTM